MELIKHNPYTPTQSIALDAMNGKKIKELKKSEFSKTIKDAIIQGLIIIGQKQTVDVTTITTDCLMEELKTSLPNYTPDEIRLAIDYGCKGKLCELTDLPQPIVTLTNILKFIRLYNEKIRKEAIHKRNELEAKEEKQINEAERDAKIKAFEQEIAKALLMTPEQIDSLPTGLKAAYYRHLESRGDSKISEAQKWAIWRECEKKVPQVQKSELGAFGDILHENKKREAKIKELSQSMAFEQIAK